MICAPFLGLGVVTVNARGFGIPYGSYGGNGGKTVFHIGINPEVDDFTYDFYAFTSSSDTTGTLTKSANPSGDPQKLIADPVRLDDQMAALLGIKMHLVSESGSAYGTLIVTSDMTMDAWQPIVVGGVRGRQITLSFNTSISGASANATYEYSVGFFDGTTAPLNFLSAVSPNTVSVLANQNGMAHL